MAGGPRFAGDLGAFGRLCLGPWLVEFCDWIEDRRQAFGPNACLLFVARDGWLPLAIARILHPEAAERLHYVLASRAALSFAEMREAADVEAFRLAMPRKGTVGDALIDRFHLTPPADADDPRLALELGDERADRFLADCVRDRMAEILARAAVHRAAFRRHLEQAVGDRLPVVVDIGYRGGTQRAFSRLLGRPVAGLYLVTHPAARAVAEEIGPVAAFDGDFVDPKSSASLVNEYRYFFEAVLSAPSGAFLHWEADGTPVFEIDPRDPTSQAIRARIHDGALAAATAAAGGSRDERVPIATVLADPDPADAALFRGLRFDDRFMGETETFVVAPPEGRARSYGLWVEGQRAADRLDRPPRPLSRIAQFAAKLENDAMRWYLTKSHWARFATNRALYLRRTNDWKLKIYRTVLIAIGRLDRDLDIVRDDGS
jgi:hypothetical protein